MMTSMIPKALFATHPMFNKMLNPAYESNKTQSIRDFMKHGSRSNFHTDMHINGEYFRSRTDNQYFCVINKNDTIDQLYGTIADFRPLHDAIRVRDYNPDKHRILRLEFTKNKGYFVESYQAISVKNPDVTIMNMPLEELLLITPKFEELPNQ